MKAGVGAGRAHSGVPRVHTSMLWSRCAVLRCALLCSPSLRRTLERKRTPTATAAWSTCWARECFGQRARRALHMLHKGVPSPRCCCIHRRLLKRSVLEWNTAKFSATPPTTSLQRTAHPARDHGSAGWEGGGCDDKAPVGGSLLLLQPLPSFSAAAEGCRHARPSCQPCSRARPPPSAPAEKQTDAERDMD